MNGKNITNLQGKIIAETEKAVRIQFKSGQETWIPKSTITAEFSSQRDIFQPFSIQTWVLEKNKIITDREQVIDTILSKIKGYHSDNLIAIFGIGSAFEKTLPDSWIKNDLDLILVVKSLKAVPKEKWDKRFFPDNKYNLICLTDNEIFQEIKKLDDIFIVILHKNIKYKIIQNIPAVYNWFMNLHSNF